MSAQETEPTETEPAEAPSVARPDGADPRDRFHCGVLVRLRPGSGTGVVRTGTGREVEFALRDIRLLGGPEGVAGLREGMEVGFDLGWTSRGVRVTMLKVF